MPGMMETILNLGLNDRTVQGLAQQSGNARFAYDSYRRFLQMYGDVVLKVPAQDFEHLLKAKRLMTGAQSDAQLDESTLRNVVEEYKSLIRATTGREFPMDVQEQLWGAIEAVWSSWNLKKAIDYRRVNGIPENLGTAVNVVAMVYGNMGDESGTGVAFTRNPSTGERRFYGEFLVNAQGEDVVAGIRDPLEIDEMAAKLPEANAELLRVQDLLERHYRDMQDLEFTVERGKLYLLQTRTGKRTAAAAIRIAGDMVDEGLISSQEALLRVDASHLDQLLHPIIDPAAHAKPIAVGLPASPGAASGRRRLRSRRGGTARRGGRCGDPRARGDHPRGLPRDRRSARRPHLARWDDEPRRGRRAGDGKVRGRRMPGRGGRRTQPILHGRRNAGERGRVDHARRWHGTRLSRRPPHDPVGGGAGDLGPTPGSGRPALSLLLAPPQVGR